MTDETYERVKVHVKENSIPPIASVLPEGIPLTVVVDDSLEPDKLELLSDSIRMCSSDYADLRRRMDVDRFA